MAIYLFTGQPGSGKTKSAYKAAQFTLKNK